MSRIAPILLTLILVHASPSRAQPGPRPLPDTPAAGRATELLEALGGDVDARRAFVAESLAPGFRERFPMEAHVDQLGLLTSRLGGAERVGVLARGPDEITLAFRTADGEELRLRVTVEPSLPHRVTGLRLEMGRAPGRGLEIASWRDLAARLEAMATDGRFSGVVLAAPGGEIAFHRAYGEADR
ncbi:MAG: hypothetical protein GWM92_12015, partial [Gemmatimonadetes bacterium]|nr:hypothetical protein [Gemmatimonadota bacterium]NIR78554.1 hypothetical protein [Gemmatimonadota bacterium]NIT88089.1 hypothetical protein [Gemmatimonadota bacterium]NIU31919.1 hypothetical protein [Gemmatimonadota bacterium]NIU36530.1 hypothetical protein [Gemmatimonadota bacterium]